MEKALPKKDKEAKVKKKPKSSASKKKAGKGGKVRYTYPSEKAKKAPPGRPVSKPTDGEEYVPPSRQPQQLPVDVGKFCAQLGIEKPTLIKIVGAFAKDKKMKGSDGFKSFMLTQAKRFSQKHGLDGSYWSRLYDAVVATSPELQT